MDVNYYSNHTLYERVVIFLRKVDCESFMAMFINHYVTISLAERNFILKKENTQFKTPTTNITNRHVASCNNNTTQNIQESLNIKQTVQLEEHSPKTVKTNMHSFDKSITNDRTNDSCNPSTTVDTTAENKSSQDNNDKKKKKVANNSHSESTQNTNHQHNDKKTVVNDEVVEPIPETTVSSSDETNKKDTKAEAYQKNTEDEATKEDVHQTAFNNNEPEDSNPVSNPDIVENKSIVHQDLDKNNGGQLNIPPDTTGDDKDSIEHDTKPKLLLKEFTIENLIDKNSESKSFVFEATNDDEKSSSGNDCYYFLNEESKTNNEKITDTETTDDNYKEISTTEFEYTDEQKYIPAIEIDWSEAGNSHILAPRLHKRCPVTKRAQQDYSSVCYYQYDKQKGQFITKESDGQWIDEQTALEYRILSNEEVNETLKKNTDFATKQQKSQISDSDFLDAITVNSTDKNSEKITTIEINNKCGAALSQSKRPQMEDTCMIKKECKDDFMFGVFDGHGGTNISSDLSSTFDSYVSNSLYDWSHTVTYKNQSVDGNVIEMSQKARNVNALIMAHVNFDKEIMRAEAVGSTSVTAIMINEDMYVSNLGDSRAILISPNGTVYQLTEDAKVMTVVDGKYQKNRHTQDMLNRGGCIKILENTNASDVTVNNVCIEDLRINNSLLIPKAFGDKSLGSLPPVDSKKHRSSCTLAISARPDIVVIEKPEQGWDGYKLLLCSDGLVDVASTDQIGDYIHTQAANGCHYGTIATDLVRAAINAGSLDNVTVLLSDVNEMKNTDQQ